MKIIKESRIEISDDIRQDLSELHQKLISKLRKIVTSDEWGFDEKDFKHYFRVDLEIMDDQRARIEIGAEVSYNGLEELCNKLDAVVQSYDEGAYFEPVDPGIAECWIEFENLEKTR